MPIKVFKLRTSQLSDLCGVTVKTVCEWALTWLAPAKVGRDSFIARQAISLWVEKIVNPPTRDGGETEQEAKRRYEIARADKEELRVKKEEQSLVSKSEAIGWLYQILSEAKTGFLAMPRRLAPEIYGKDPREIEGRIDDEVKRILRKLARPIEQQEKEEPKIDKPKRTTGRAKVSAQPARKPKRQPVGRKTSSSGRANKR